MNADEVPRGCRPVLCIRCGEHLAVPHDVWANLERRQELLVDHHAWLCANPTPGVATARATAEAVRRKDAGEDPPWR